MISNDKRIYDTRSNSAKRMMMIGDSVGDLKILILGSGGRSIFLSPEAEVIPAGPNKLLSVFRALAIAKKIGKNHPFDVITAQDPFLAGLAGFFIKKSLGCKLQIQLHTDVMNPFFRKESFLNYLRYKLGLFLIPRADSIRVVSTRSKNSLLSKFLDLKIDVLPVFVDADRIKTGRVRFDLHEKYPQFDFIILMVSRFAKEKNIEMAIGAMSEIVKKYPRTGLVIVGRGSLEREYILRIKDLGLGQNVRIEPWTEDIISYYKTADLFILTSNYEGYGLALVEAMLTGCPIVSTDVGIADEIIENGRNGFVIKVGDKTALMKAILELMENEELLAAMKQNNLNANPFPYPSAQSYFENYKKLLEMK